MRDSNSACEGSSKVFAVTPEKSPLFIFENGKAPALPGLFSSLALRSQLSDA
jgi:hypothetical protein